MREQKRSYGINVGSSSILLIFVILCLVSFSVLAISSAQADRSLSIRLKERTTAYYEARNQAEKELADLNRELKEALDNSDNEKDYFSSVGHERSISVPLSEDQNLEVKVTILYPPTDKSFYRIESYRVATMDSGIVFDDSLDVFTGDFNEEFAPEEAVFGLPLP